ncbi:MAG: hypothetical protein ABIY70_02565, partial [Capsulimonas sp.]
MLNKVNQRRLILILPSLMLSLVGCGPKDAETPNAVPPPSANANPLPPNPNKKVFAPKGLAAPGGAGPAGAAAKNE